MAPAPSRLSPTKQKDPEQIAFEHRLQEIFSECNSGIDEAVVAPHAAEAKPAAMQAADHELGASTSGFAQRIRQPDPDSDSEDEHGNWKLPDQYIAEIELQELEEEISTIGEQRPRLRELVTKLMSGYQNLIIVGEAPDIQADGVDEVFSDASEMLADHVAMNMEERSERVISENQLIRLQKLYEKKPFKHPEVGEAYMVDTPGSVAMYTDDDKAAAARTQKAVDDVMDEHRYCCTHYCLSKWKQYFGPEKARQIITVERTINSGMDAVQRALYHEGRLKGSRELIMKHAVVGELKEQVGTRLQSFVFETDKIKLCQQAYIAITGLTLRTLQRYCYNVRNDLSKPKVGRPPLTELPRTKGARAWFKSYCALHDRMPHKSRYGHTEIHLDVARKTTVWKTYRDFMRTKYFDYSEILCERSFLRMWENEFPHVKVRKPKTIASKCRVCEDLQELISKAQTNKRARALRILQMEHLLFQQAERNLYYHRRNQAVSDPHNYTSMIVDGMTQIVCNIPRKARFEYEGKLLNQKLVGVLVHGREQQLHLHRVFPWIPQGANLTISCIWKTIKKLVDEGKMPLNRTLYLQVDGATDNVNQTMLKFLCWLCQQKICRTVYFTRLPVGHTHEDIDQKFSIIARKLKSSDIITPAEFEWAVLGAFLNISRDAEYHVQCTMETMWTTWDFFNWLKHQSKDVFPFVLERWARREDTIHQIRICLSMTTGFPDSTLVYMATKQWASKFVREVKTRHLTGSASADTDKLRQNPTCKPKTSLFYPSDSKHGGFLYCQAPIEGEPELVRFHLKLDKDGNELPGLPAWRGEIADVRSDLGKNYQKSGIFWQERRDNWEEFFESVIPYKGPEFLPSSRKPVFLHVPPKPSGPAPISDDINANLILHNVGQDQEGRERLFFKNGQDVAVYEPAKMWVTFNGRTLDGTMFTVRTQQKRTGLFHNQKVAVSFAGLLREATNLKRLVGEQPETLYDRCGGWWLAQVDGYYLEDGSYLEAPQYRAPDEPDDDSEIDVLEPSDSDSDSSMTPSEADDTEGEKELIKKKVRVRMGAGTAARRKKAMAAAKGKKAAGGKAELESEEEMESEERSSGEGVRGGKTIAAKSKGRAGAKKVESGKAGGGVAPPNPSKSSGRKKRGAPTSEKLPSKKKRKEEKEEKKTGAEKLPSKKKRKEEKKTGAKPIKEKKTKKEQKKARAGPKITHARLTWMVAYDDDLVPGCFPTNPMVPLQTNVNETESPEYITDKISRQYLFYEEARPNRTFTNAGKVHRSELRKMQQYAPDPTKNAAGERVGIGAYEPEPGEFEVWDATLKELIGFSWSWKSEPLEEEESTKYKVIGLRRYDNMMFAIITTDEDDKQLDHSIMEIREKMYYCTVAFKYKELPHFLQWPQLMRSRFAYDFNGVLHANAQSYKNATSKRANEVLIPPRQHSKLPALSAKDVVSVFKEASAIRLTLLNHAVELIVDSLLETAETGKMTNTLVGPVREMREWRPNIDDKNRLALLKGLVEHGLRRQRLVIESLEQVIAALHVNFRHVILPIQLSEHHVIVCEFKFDKEPLECKVWDPVGLWTGKQGNDVPEIISVACTFLLEDTPMKLNLNREPEDPCLQEASASALFAFFTMAHLAVNLSPSKATEDDEGFIVSYMWACVREGKLLELPSPKYVK